MVDKAHKAVHVGEAAARILERLKRSAAQLPTVDRKYDCEDCRDTGLITGKNGTRRCQHVKQIEAQQDREKFF